MTAIRLGFQKVALISVSLMLAGSVACAQEMSAMATQAVKVLLRDAVPAFEGASQGVRVTVAWVGSSEISKRVKEGEVVDMVFLAKPAIDELIKLGKLAPGSRVDLAKSGVGIAVPSGTPVPDVSTTDALKRALLAARSVAVSSGSSAVYLQGLFQRMGIADDLKPRLKQVASGLSVGEVIAKGEAEIGFQQVSELLHIAGITFAGPLPADIQNYTTYAGAIHTSAKSPDQAMALLKYLKSDAALGSVKKAGMEPVGAP